MTSPRTTLSFGFAGLLLALLGDFAFDPLALGFGCLCLPLLLIAPLGQTIDIDA